MVYKPSSRVVRDVATRAIDIFSSQGLKCCIFGGLACSLYGVTRTPGDVDLVIFTTEHSLEELKQILCDNDSKFFLVPSMKPFATYKVLWYGYPTYRQCKVDVLLPGIMNIPRVPDDRIIYQNDLPVMPLLPLLMLKLQGWEDHRNHQEMYMRRKQHSDVSDVRGLLKIARQQGVHLADAAHVWIPPLLINETKRRVILWTEKIGSTESTKWKALGFGRPPQSTISANDALAEYLGRMSMGV
ncbi:hypothetical protein OBBRIDRAFT_799534 [Obba rivulosa]|uniref:Uncharacterized protein n=1 Tax=Obba rivulosa TaxID=1052685 RepID=A0A8E2AG80_9APHY|nr:hypothetical protein OBBRIDRAFT_799534 [Obba rivulosa]